MEDTLNNSIVRNAQGGATDTPYSGDYFSYYASGSSAFSPAHTYTTDPYSSGLLYPVRVESGSTLANAVSGGIGANIQYKIGADGTFYGDSGWNTPTSISLWPWPLEAWVQAQMAAMNTTIGGSAMPSPTRGFAGGTSKDG